MIFTSEVSGKYTGISGGNNPLVGIHISGKRTLLKWFYCKSPKLLEEIRSSISEGYEVTARIISDQDGKRNYITGIKLKVNL